MKGSNKEVKIGGQSKAIVELNKDNYLITTLKNDRSKICLCVMSNFNRDDAKNPGQDLQIGDEVEVKVVGKSELGLYNLVPAGQSE